MFIRICFVTIWIHKSMQQECIMRGEWSLRVYHERRMVTQSVWEANGHSECITRGEWSLSVSSNRLSGNPYLYYSIYRSHMNPIHNISLRSTLLLLLITVSSKVLSCSPAEVYRRFGGSAASINTSTRLHGVLPDNNILSNSKENVKSNIVTAIYQPNCA
jgi:hypothetical protein